RIAIDILHRSSHLAVYASRVGDEQMQFFSVRIRSHKTISWRSSTRQPKYFVNRSRISGPGLRLPASRAGMEFWLTPTSLASRLWVRSRLSHFPQPRRPNLYLHRDSILDGIVIVN